MLRKNFPGRKVKRQEEARERQAASDIRKAGRKLEVLRASDIDIDAKLDATNQAFVMALDLRDKRKAK
jgi:hypothetical protein